MILNPNCSSVTVRLPDIGEIIKTDELEKLLNRSNIKPEDKKAIAKRMKSSIYDDNSSEFVTDSLCTNEVLEDFICHLDHWTKEDVDSISGIPDMYFGECSGDGEYVEDVWRIARLYKYGHLTKEQAQFLDINRMDEKPYFEKWMNRIEAHLNDTKPKL